MARDNFTILVDLQDYFSDDRQRSKIYINQNYMKISDLVVRISEIFGIKGFHLLSDGHFLPFSEDIGLLRNGETVSVKPNITLSQSILPSDSIYGKDDTSYKSTIKDVHPLKGKRKKKFPGDQQKVDDEVLVDHINNDQCRLHASTPNSSEVFYTSNTSKKRKHKNKETMDSHSFESNVKKIKRNIDECRLDASTANIAEVFHIPNTSKKRKHKNREPMKSDSFESNVKNIETNIDECNLDASTPNISEVFHTSDTSKKRKHKNREAMEYHSFEPNVKKIKTNLDECRLDASTANISEVFHSSDTPKKRKQKNREVLKSHSFESNVKKIKNNAEKSSGNEDTSPILLKSKKKKCKKTNEEECSIEVSTQSNYECSKGNSGDSKVNPSQNEEFNICEKSIESHAVAEDKCYPSVLHYKKAKSTQSWSTSPLPKTTNIVKIMKTPLEKIEIDHSRFDYIFNDSLPPLEPIIVEMKDTNNSNTEANAMFPVESQIGQDDSQHSIELIRSENVSNEPKEIKSPTLDVSTDCSEESQQTELLNPSGTKQQIESQDLSNLSQHVQSQKYPEEKGHMKSQKFSEESQQMMKPLDSSDIGIQQIKSQKCSNNDNIEFIQSQNLPELSEQSQKSCEVSEQTKSLNLDNLSRQTKSEVSSDITQKELEISRTQQPKSFLGSMNLSNFEDRLAELVGGDIKKSRSETREWWRYKIGCHTTDSKNLTNHKFDDLEAVKLPLVSHNSLSDENSVAIGGLVECTYFSETKKSGNTNDSRMKPPELDPEYLLKENPKSREEIGTADCKTKLASEISEDSATFHETITDAENFPVPKRRRRRHRRKKEVKLALPRQEKITFPYKMVNFVPAKPKIHIRFHSSDDDVSSEKNSTIGVENDLATPTEKIKILQDVIINQHENSSERNPFAENKVEIESSIRDEKLSDRCEKTDETCDASALTNKEAMDRLLQMKKEELLSFVSSIVPTDQQTENLYIVE